MRTWQEYALGVFLGVVWRLLGALLVGVLLGTALKKEPECVPEKTVVLWRGDEITRKEVCDD